MNVTLRQLRALLALARSGSFTQAAAALHLTQSALSGQIKELELALGVRLVDRTTRSAELTAVGREFVPLVQQTLADLEHALASVDDLKALRKGVVRIAAPQLMACTLLPEVIAGYSACHPDVQVRLTDCAVEQVQALVAAGSVDLGIGPERPAGAELAAQPLFELPFMAVFPQGHGLQHLPRISWSDVVDYPFIALQGQFTERLALDLQVALRPSQEVAFMSTALSLVRAGQGVTACLPYATSLVRLYQLQMRPLHGPELRRKFQLYSRAGTTPAPAVARFMQFLLDYVASHGWNAAAG
jgi:DNA-binding transcriptional LysR family regulator